MRPHRPRPLVTARAEPDAGGLLPPHLQWWEQPSWSVSAGEVPGERVRPRCLYRVSPAARHEAQQPANGCDDEEDDAYPQQPTEGFGEAAYQEKNNCHYAGNDQKCIHGQHIPFQGNL